LGGATASTLPGAKAVVESAREPALWRRFPELVERAPRLPIGSLPTRVERAEKLGRELGLPELWVKRDDLAAEPYGGGKVRKLELLLAAAQRAGKKRVLTFGGVSSNHGVATAIYGARAGLAVELWLAPQPVGPHTAENLLAMAGAGASLRLVSSVARAQSEARGAKDAYVIDPGGTSALGNLAYVAAAFELAEQIEAGAMPRPAKLFLPLGTMGCAAGLALGLARAGVDAHVVGVRASSRQTSSFAALEALLSRTAREVAALAPSLRLDPEAAMKRIRIDGTQLGKGYALPTPAADAALALASRTEGWHLETTYTGKCLAALAAAAPRLEHEVVLLWLTHSAHGIDVSHVAADTLPRAFQRYLG
jgi:D-cysteine desulfhydrase